MKVLVSDLSYVLLFPKQHGIGGRPSEMYNAIQPVFDQFQLNLTFLEYIGKVHQTWPTYLFTNGTMHTVPEIRAELDRAFTDCFSVSDIGFAKHQPEAFTSLAARIKVKPDEIVFVDDMGENIAASRIVGVIAVKYESNHQIMDELRKYFYEQ